MRKVGPIHRFGGFAAVILLTGAFAWGALTVSGWWWTLAGTTAALLVLGALDLVQHRHTILRNYPVIGHLRYFFEKIRPEIRQYLIESDHDEEPFSREERSIVYQRSKGEEGARPFGTKKAVYDGGYAWMTHSIAPVRMERHNFRGQIAAGPTTHRFSTSRRCPSDRCPARRSRR